MKNGGVSRKRLWAIGGIAGAIVLAAGWWLTAPLFFDKEVNEEFPMSAGAEIPDDMTAEEVEAEMEEAAKGPNDEVTEPMPEEEGPIAVKTGDFENADDFHQGSGTATIYELEDGSHALRLEDFEVTNGPDLHVYLVPDSDPLTTGNIDGYVNLGSLKGNLGDQNYDIPADADPTAFGSVVIYCEPFHVLFSAAGLG